MRKMRYLGLAVLFALCVQLVMADTWNKKTKVTFSGPVQVPGVGKVVTLPAGSYVFKLVDSSADRRIIQVTNLRGDKLYTTILAIPDYRINPTSKTVMYFSERASGLPPAIKSWFYPGDNFGNRFVYPKAQAVVIAAAVKQPVPSHVDEPVTKAAEAPKVAVVTPQAAEQKYEVLVFEKIDVADTAGTDGEPVKEEAPAAPAAPLPKTSSPIHVVAALGGLLLASSGIARYAKSKLS
jgi:hypothetical protein